MPVERVAVSNGLGMAFTEAEGHAIEAGTAKQFKMG